MSDELKKKRGKGSQGLMISVVSDFSAFEETTDNARHMADYGTWRGKEMKRRDINYVSSSRGDLRGEALEDHLFFRVCFMLINGSQPTQTQTHNHTNTGLG